MPVNTSIQDQCSILIPSCDAYSDLWDPFFQVFRKFWPDCPFPVYLGCNRLRPSYPGVQAVPAEDGRIWSNQVKIQIAAVPTPYVLIMLEDFFLRRPVHTASLLACAQEWLTLRPHCLRLVRRPGPNTRLPGQSRFGVINPDAPYRVSTQGAIWNKDTLLALLHAGESIWEFELNGTRRSREFTDGFYGTWRDELPYDHHVVERGKWFRKEVRWCRKMGVACDTQRRPMMNRRETLGWKLGKARSLAADCVPYSARRVLRAWMGKAPI